jgi:hypothetical protein
MAVVLSFLIITNALSDVDTVMNKAVQAGATPLSPAGFGSVIFTGIICIFSE